MHDSKLDAGDERMKVKCIDDKRNNLLEFGRIYEVLENSTSMYFLEYEFGNKSWFSISRFEVFEEKDNIKPKHYNKGEIDLYESWYLTRPFNEFRAVMESIAERYMKRDKIDRIEDLDKCIETLTRLRAYELRHKEE